MLWHRQKQKDNNGNDLSVGQQVDLGEAVADLWMKKATGSILNLGSLAGFGLDVSMSTAKAKRGNTMGAGISAVAAQGAGLSSWGVGGVVGATIGEFLLPFGGAVAGFDIGEIVGSTAAALTVDKFVRTRTQRFFNAVKDTRPRVRFGGFKDSQPAYTMRQRAEQELSGSLLNARQYLGKEAQLMHQ